MGAFSVSVSANSLLIVPPGFNPFTDFASFGNLGVTYTLGNTLTVAAGRGFAGSCTIVDPVNCQGSITAASSTGLAYINLSSGLTLSGTGTIQLGFGTLTTNGLQSSISGGLLSDIFHCVGIGGTGTFTQSGGTNDSEYLYLGYAPGDSGTYNLSGSGQLLPDRQYVGYSGSGTLNQSGGTNGNNDGDLLLGFNVGSNGTYSLSGSGRVSEVHEYVGYSGTGALRNPVGRTMSATPSISVTTPAATELTFSAAAAKSQHPMST